MSIHNQIVKTRWCTFTNNWCNYVKYYCVLLLLVPVFECCANASVPRRREMVCVCNVFIFSCCYRNAAVRTWIHRHVIATLYQRPGLAHAEGSKGGASLGRAQRTYESRRNLGLLDRVYRRHGPQQHSRPRKPRKHHSAAKEPI